MPEINLLTPRKYGYKLEQMGPLVRDGYTFHEPQRAWYVFDMLETEECVAHIAFLNAGEIEHLSVKSHNTLSAKFAARRMADKAIAKHPLAMATAYGFKNEKAQALLDKGFQWNLGTFIRREKLSDCYRVTVVFLTDDNHARRTVGIARTMPTATKRAYKFVRFIQEHGSLIAAFHAQADAAEMEVA